MSELKFILEQYELAKAELSHCQESFDAASGEWIDYWAVRIKAAEIKMNIIIKELKKLNIINKEIPLIDEEVIVDEVAK